MTGRLLKVAAVVVALAVALLGLSVALQLRMPDTPGPVGRTLLRVRDDTRLETMTDAPTDRREIAAWIWYPAVAGTGERAPYFPDLAVVAADLAASGEVSPVEVTGMRLVRSKVRRDADVDLGATPYPVVVLLPGNGTNVEFYHALSASLAADGYVVVGINHPYDVAAVALSDGRVARFAASTFTMDPAQREVFVSRRIVERVRDVLALLDSLAAPGGAGEILGGALDLSRVSVVGHSLGAIAAAELCRAVSTIRSWVNLDGQQRGGPFSTDPAVGAPDQPFLFVTKETQLHPQFLAGMEAIEGGSRHVVLSGAVHDSFTDGPLLLPSLLPVPGRADRIFELIRGYVAGFLDETLKGVPSAFLTGPAPAHVTVDVFPGVRGTR